MTENRVLFDYDRAARTSVPEAVFCQSKSREVIYSLMEEFSQADAPAILFTRLSEEVFSSCPAEVSRHYSFDSLARIAFCKKLDQEHQGSVAVVSAGTADRLRHLGSRAYAGIHEYSLPSVRRLRRSRPLAPGKQNRRDQPPPHHYCRGRHGSRTRQRSCGTHLPAHHRASPLLWDTASVTAEKLP